jgi:tetraacyldisaccharide-1-P 4'-kinase
VLSLETSEERIEELRQVLGVPTIFQVRRELGAVRWIADGAAAPPSPAAAVVAVAAIAQPQRFFDDLNAAGWRLVGALSFRDHHRYDRPDVDRIARVAREAGAAAIVTTEKDAVRFEPLLSSMSPLPFAVAPMTVTIEPPSFADWLVDRLRDARAAAVHHGAARTSLR